LSLKSTKSNLNIDQNWSSSAPFNFFGPCSAETQSQLGLTAEGISKNYNNYIFRAGIWKPRTRPNTFEGVGSIGLDWLIDIKKEFKIPVATEVANAEHVELCLKAGVDVLWLGARTTVSPFTVQEIAEALKGVDVQVFVKNPIHADLSLWIGAIERINKVGITKLGAIHRGFHQFDSSPYRNAPKWEIAIDLKSRFPNLPVVCDVSHISGTPELIQHVAQISQDLDMDGLMIETHVDPTIALSDAKQQLTPQGLFEVESNLVKRTSQSDNENFTANLEKFRGQIDVLDTEILSLLSRRMQMAQKIGQEKKENKITIFQIERWNEISALCINKGEELELGSNFIKAVYDAIHNESIRHQNIIMNKD
jgi:chorismate mutase